MKISAYELRRFQHMIVAHVLQHGNDHRYNVPLLIQFNSEWSKTTVDQILERFLSELPELSFKLCQHGEDFLLTRSSRPIPVHKVDTDGDELNLCYFVKTAHQQAFDLFEDALSRFTVIQHGSQIVVLCVFHHLIVDGLTLDNMKRLMIDLAQGSEVSEVVSPFLSEGRVFPKSDVSQSELRAGTLEPGSLYFYEADLFPRVKAISQSRRATFAEVLLCATGYAFKGVSALNSLVVPHSSRSSLQEFNATGCLTALVELDISDSGDLDADLESYREQLALTDFRHTEHPPGLFSFREIDIRYGERSGITFSHENALFKHYDLLAPNKTGVSALFELIGNHDKRHLHLTLEYDQSRYSDEDIREISYRINHYLSTFDQASLHRDHLPSPAAVLTSPNQSGGGLAIRYFSADGHVRLHTNAVVQERIAYYRNVFQTRQTHTLLIAAPKSLDVLAAIFACYDLDITYIPLDPQHPKEVRDGILAATGANAILVQSDTGPTLEFLNGSQRLVGIQYVIYTSGSTGTPKGVKIRKQSLHELCQSMAHALDLESPIRALSYADLHFDMSVPDLYLPYLYGGEIVVLDHPVRANPEQLHRIINSVDVTLMQCTPTALGMFTPHQQRTLKVEHLILGGERVPRSLSPNLLPCVNQLWNFYGPTEATVWCAYRKVAMINDVDIDSSLNGYNIALYRNGRACRAYELGEVYVRGPISSGYMDERLNKSAFLDLTCHGEVRRYYATGDLGEFIPDRGIRLHGRKDAQIKHNGVRIELEEIDAAFCRIEGVRDCVAAYDESCSRLIALVYTVDKALTEDLLLNAIGEHLPELKMPSEVILIDHIPVNTNGKKERNLSRLTHLLSARSSSSIPAQRESSYRHGVRHEIVNILTKALNMDSSGSLDKTFYEQGGSSIKAIQIIQQLRRTGVEVEVTDLVNSRKMSHFLDRVMERLP